MTVPQAAQLCSSAAVWFKVRLSAICLTHYTDVEVSTREVDANIHTYVHNLVSTHEEASNTVTYCRAGCQCNGCYHQLEDLAGGVRNEILRRIQNTTFVYCICTYTHIYYAYTHCGEERVRTNVHQILLSTVNRWDATVTTVCH